MVNLVYSRWHKFYLFRTMSMWLKSPMIFGKYKI